MATPTATPEALAPVPTTHAPGPGVTPEPDDDGAPMLDDVANQVLLVEDDDGIALPLTRMLEREGNEVVRTDHGGEALRHLREHAVDLVILDLGLPDMDGLDVCRQARTDGYEGGILVVTARGSELDRVLGLDVGADDYLPKPFAVAELLARARALLRRSGRALAGSDPTEQAEPAEPAVPTVPAPSSGPTGPPGPDRPTGSDLLTGSVRPLGSDRPNGAVRPQGLRLDAAARRTWVGDQEVALTTKEFDVLHLLDVAAGAVVTREQLMSDVWDENWFGSTKTLDVTIGRLRAKLAEAGAAVQVTTVRGVGFRLETDA